MRLPYIFQSRQKREEERIYVQRYLAGVREQWRKKMGEELYDANAQIPHTVQWEIEWAIAHGYRKNPRHLKWLVDYAVQAGKERRCWN